jgi:hypothetical protein
MKLVSIFFIAIFLTVNHLHSTFASPIVSGDTVAANRSLNLTNTLATRTQPDAVPSDQRCNHSIDWLYRRCTTTLLDQGWVDLCESITSGVRYSRFGSCPLGTMCMNTMSPTANPPGLHYVIFCLSRPITPKQGPSGAKGAPQIAIGQVGVVPITAYNLVPVEHLVPVKVGRSIANATIAALIEGTYQISQWTLIWQLTVVKYAGLDGNYIVEPHQAMVGSVRGSQTKVCLFNATERDCVPAGRYNIPSGTYIDFTFGLDAYQEVRFYYAIMWVL